jgi:formylglycine-generating enzyme required for sulfatase activity
VRLLVIAWLLADGVAAPVGKTTVIMATPAPRVVVAAGPFRMGASADDLQLARRLCSDELRGGGALTLEVSPRCGSRFDNEGPQVEVFVPAFAIDRTEVTVAAYATCIRQRGCRPAPEPVADDRPGTLPVERVTWSEAAAFCRWRSGRLPTEAEWEKAARGFGRRSWPWGVDWQEGRANHGRAPRSAPGGGSGDEETLDDADGFAGRAPVGSFAAGASVLGLQDMAGNVWEWTSGYFGREPPQAATRYAPQGPLVGEERTIRGGSYRSPPSDLRLTRRLGLAPEERLPGVGFRCAYDVAPP